jgi:hypothetical protein
MLSSEEQALRDAIVSAIRQYSPISVQYNSIERVLLAVIEELADKAGEGEAPAATAELFTAAGEVLFGKRWKADMAGALGGIGSSTVDDWSKARRPVPERVWSEVVSLLRARWQEIPKVLSAAQELTTTPRGEVTELRIGPSIIGTEFSVQVIDFINQQFANLGDGHSFSGATARPFRGGAIMVRVPRALSTQEREGLKDWAARTISSRRAPLTVNLFRTTNTSDID